MGAPFSHLVTSVGELRADVYPAPPEAATPRARVAAESSTAAIAADLDEAYRERLS